MADRDAWKKIESLWKIFAAGLILGVASLLANPALEEAKTRTELLNQVIDVVFLSKSDQMDGADKSFESRRPFKPAGNFTSSRWAGGLAIEGKIFISYRRDDSAAYAGRVWDRLERDLGRHSLFMEVDAIPLGTNFPNVLHEEVAKCGVLLAMIGPNWLDVRDEHKNRRLDDPKDYVRIEIAQALRRDIPVIPILLDDATIPKADQLPENLKELASRNGIRILHASFHDDMNRLIRKLKGQLDQAGSSDEPTTADAQQSDPAVAQGAHSLKPQGDAACYAGAGQGYGSSSTSRMAATPSFATPVKSAARASWRSGAARHTSAAAPSTG